MSRARVLVGAVIYDPKVVTIWDGIKDHFAKTGCPIDYVFYSHYSLMVDALVAGHIDIAWNSPLAWVDTVRRTGGGCRAIAMRDTDRDRVTHLIARRDAAVERIEDLRARTFATGASDSPQATLLPLRTLRRHGLVPHSDVRVRRFDVMVGKHGDHIGGEQDALRSVVARGSDACAVLDLNWARWLADGTADEATLRVIGSTDRFDHCNFTALESFPGDLEREWTAALFDMRYDEPAHRELMDMEGLTAWLPGRSTGYGPLTEAVDQERFFEREAA